MTWGEEGGFRVIAGPSLTAIECLSCHRPVELALLTESASLCETCGPIVLSADDTDSRREMALAALESKSVFESESTPRTEIVVEPKKEPR